MRRTFRWVFSWDSRQIAPLPNTYFFTHVTSSFMNVLRRNISDGAVTEADFASGIQRHEAFVYYDGERDGNESLAIWLLLPCFCIAQCKIDRQAWLMQNYFNRTHVSSERRTIVSLCRHVVVSSIKAFWAEASSVLTWRAIIMRVTRYFLLQSAFICFAPFELIDAGRSAVRCRFVTDLSKVSVKHSLTSYCFFLCSSWSSFLSSMLQSKCSKWTLISSCGTGFEVWSFLQMLST